jgi:flagellar hook-associated protein 3 FlgL
MLDRVGSWSLSQGLINEYGRIQGRNQKWQTQISTGKVGDHLADVKDKASVLVAAKQKSAGVDSYLSATKEVLNRLDIQDLHLKQMSDISSRLRTAVGDALSSGRAPGMMNEVRGLYAEAVAILNVRIDGKFIYGGSRTDVAPVSATAGWRVKRLLPTTHQLSPSSQARPSLAVGVVEANQRSSMPPRFRPYA